jgi:hypothetical protein
MATNSFLDTQLSTHICHLFEHKLLPIESGMSVLYLDRQLSNRVAWALGDQLCCVLTLKITDPGEVAAPLAS